MQEPLDLETKTRYCVAALGAPPSRVSSEEGQSSRDSKGTLTGSPDYSTSLTTPVADSPILVHDSALAQHEDLIAAQLKLLPQIQSAQRLPLAVGGNDAVVLTMSLMRRPIETLPLPRDNSKTEKQRMMENMLAMGIPGRVAHKYAFRYGVEIMQ